VHLEAPGSGNNKSGSADDESGSAEDKPVSADNKPGSADNKPGSTDNKPGSANTNPGSTLGAPRINVKQSGKNDLFGNVAGAPGNHSYYLLFKDFLNSCSQFVFSSIYLFSYPFTNGISGLAAAGA